jgi:NUMOD3 motif
MSAPKDPIKAAEWRKNLSNSHANVSGKNNPMFGKHHTEESIRKIREARKGTKASDAARRNMSKPRKNRVNFKSRKPFSDETIKKFSEMRKGKNNPRWKGGVSFEPYCEKFDKPFKERVRIFFGRICVECGKTEKENGKRLDVHHVNFDKQTCCNGVKPLYVALCKPCHTKTQGNREYWEKHFTEIINNKYDGKCYLPKEC